MMGEWSSAKQVLVRGSQVGAVVGGLACLGYVLYKNRFKIMVKVKPPDLTLHDYKGFKFTKEMMESVKKLEDFEARSDDIYISTYPKSGTTWVQELTYVLHHRCDFARAKCDTLEERFPFLELKTMFGLRRQIDDMPAASSRLIKTHLPYEVLPEDIKHKRCKIIYCTRNPKDVSVSLYNFTRFLVFHSNKETFAEFFQHFITGNTVYAPYWQHNITFWNLRHEDNILFLKYEDLHKDCVGAARQLATFLDRGDLTDSDLRAAALHCSFPNMRDNAATNYLWMERQGLADCTHTTFMRKGVVGDWKRWYTVEMSERMDRAYAVNMANTDLRHDFQLPPTSH